MSDLVIMGSGVAGNFAAACFRRYFPSVRVTVVGRSETPADQPRAGPKADQPSR